MSGAQNAYGGGNPNCPHSFARHGAKAGHGLSILLNLLSGVVHIVKDDKICAWGALSLCEGRPKDPKLAAKWTSKRAVLRTEWAFSL